LNKLFEGRVVVESIFEPRQKIEILAKFAAVV